MRNNSPLLVWLVILTLVAAILYFLWIYLVAFLAICGALQLLRLWNRNRQQNSSRNFSRHHGKF